MSFKLFSSLFFVGCIILFGFIFLISQLNQQNEDREAWVDEVDEYLSKRDNAPPQIPRTEEIPDEIRHKFAAVTEIPERPGTIAEFVQEGTLETVEFSPTTPNLVVSTDYDKNFKRTVRLWDINTPTTPIAEFKGDAAAFSPDGKILAISNSREYDASVKLWDMAKEEFIGSLRTSGDNAVFSPDRRFLAVETFGIELWNISDPTQPIEDIKLKGKNIEEEHTFSPDGKLIATTELVSDKVNIWHIDGNQVIKKNTINVIDKEYGRIEALQFSPDPQNPILAVADNDEDIRLYYPPDWQNYNTIPTKNVYDLAFAPDGKTIITGGIDEIEIWSVENGKLIASIDGHSDWVKCVDISADGNFIAAGGNDGVMRVWNITDYLPVKQRSSIQDVVVPIYFLPTNLQPQADMPERIDKMLKDVQAYFADEMEQHGLGRKTFNFEKNSDGTAKIFLFEGKTSYKYYSDKSSRVIDEIEEHFELSNNLYFIILEKSEVKKTDEKETTAADAEKLRKEIRELSLTLSGYMFREKGGHIVVQTPLNRYTTHKLAQDFGEEFGLHRDYRDPSYLMSDGRASKHLSKDSALWLSSSGFFNSRQMFFDKKTSINKLSRLRDKLRLEIEDADGISQIRLLAASNNDNPPPGFQKEIDLTENQTTWKRSYKGYTLALQDVLTLQGEKKAKVELDYPKYLDSLIELHVIDDNGNRVKFYEITESPLTTILRGIFN